MENTIKLSRYIILGLFVAGIMLFYSLQLMTIQIVEGEEYYESASFTTSSSITVPAVRGEIVDRFGRPLAQNRMGYSIVIDKSSFDIENQNNVILQLIRLLGDGEEWVNEMPLQIDSAGNASFIKDPNSTVSAEESTAVKKMKKILKIQDYGTAQNCLETMLEKYELGNAVTPEAVKIMSVRYTMELKEFTRSNPYVFAEDISEQTVQRVAEASAILKGINIEEVAYREYPNGDAAAHIIGTVGNIYAEEYAVLKDKGYGINDKVGKSGIEKEYESYLRGTNGKKQIVRDKSNNIVDTNYLKDAETGNTLVLTLDIDLQRTAQQSLENCLKAIQSTGGYTTGEDCNAGSAVVLDCRTGETLAAVTYPYYDYDTYKNDYSSLLKDEASPLFNRALNGLYAPGSTFKPVIALAALQERIISASDTVNCIKVYEVDDFKLYCLSYHGPVNVKTALTVSCNSFFYEMGMRLTINKMNDYCRRVGLGSKTGIGLGESKGTLAGREDRQSKGNGAWVMADTLTAAIGQNDNRFTPIQLANYIATIGNGGYHYETSIVKTIKSYGLDETIVEDRATNPVLLNTLECEEAVLETVRDSLLSVTTEGTAVKIFGGYEIRVGGKTGTAELSKTETSNGLFVAFAPYDKPEIAVAIVGEHAYHGSWMAPVAKDIFDEYFYGKNSKGETLVDESGLLQ